MSRTRYEFSENEKIVMLCLWKEKAPLTVGEIFTRCKDNGIRWGSLRGMMNGLLKKEAVVVAEHRLEGKRRERAFLPLIFRDEYLTNQLETDSAYLPEMVPYLVNCLLPDMKAATLAKLREVVTVERNTKE